MRYYGLAVLFSLVLFAPAAVAQTADVNNGHLLDARWTATATNPDPPGPTPGPLLGDSITLTWGFVQDGTGIDPNTGTPESSDPSSLISFLDNNFGDTPSANLTTQSWFPIFSETFDRYGAISGLDFVYEPNDNGATLNGSSNPGDLGVVADVRIGGHSVDGTGNPNTLAYNFFPNSGDMVLDTDNVSFFNSDTVGFRNVIAHEFGHGLGIDHLLSNSEQFLLEPFINTSFNGPQHSDILALHRGYGDHFEDGTGNDSTTDATSLGNIDVFMGVGLDGSNTNVAITDEDFVSIDGTTDTDFFSFNVTQTGQVTIDVTPEGYSYDLAEQAADGTADEATRQTVNTSALSDLEFILRDASGAQIATANANGIGVAESLAGIQLAPGTYFIEVSGTEDRAQFYSITTDFVAAVPEPSSAMLLALGVVVPVLRRKRA